MARRMGIRTQPPRGVTLAVAAVLWLVGAAEMFLRVDFPFDLGRWALLLAGALLIVACLVRGL